MLLRVTRLPWLVAGLLIPTFSEAQLQVTVQGPAGEPVAAALVQLRRGAQRGATRVTDRTGRAHFTEAEAGGTDLVQARRIGFAPSHTPYSPGTHSLTIVLQSVATVLPEINVGSATQGCPQRDDRAARERWETSRRLYDDTTTLGRTSALQYVASVVDGDSVGQFDPARLLPGYRGTNAPALRGLRADIAEYGYAWMLPERHYYWDYGVWGYPVLEADYAQHFTEALFGARHTFTFDRTAGSDAVVLRFCPRNRKQSGLEGTLRLEADASLVSARWQYWNPRHDAEPAGGEVVFAVSVQPGARPVLTAANGLFWRQLRSGRYYQRWQQYDGWVLTGGDTLAAVARR